MLLCHFPLTDRPLLTDHLPSKDTTSILANYLSELTFSDQDDFGLLLPKENMPEGFQLDRMRCCKRALYSFMPGFKIELSKEISPRNDTTTEASRVSVWTFKRLFLTRIILISSLNIFKLFHRRKFNNLLDVGLILCSVSFHCNIIVFISAACRLECLFYLVRQVR